ncbi:UDP-N-acetylmuramyl-tripeptide synthetase [Sphaerochaeta pleomorpha str. Grapes]|uniref:UDP-N-acetylmuramyl-tripeptide synthetase n=1 Tax=Sphaerochaeta pleomorpha (strain ATCC BAA-1885 / DSM 22778 / Grapes) TaxID=158190 RepID=G8QQN0_SPHPG|nr:UDP-N-acetylmuramyl-tripeptide synthetase [Sphaerochaeta pleomorpha]AEV30960.1 UDP-N-acetylmuramyl-tripeptide synthetase [Sphaerochaeta pleomorpha str. Grapes]
MEKLADLLNATGLDGSIVDSNLCLTSLCYDSRQCKPDCAFFAFDGIHTDGQNYIPQAIENGAICIISKTEPKDKQQGIYYFQTPNPRSLFANMCAAFYDYPAKKLILIGITGTDGKSTTCDYLHQILTKHGIKTGLLGTVSMDDGKKKQISPYRQSTPEADSLQQFLSRCADNGLTHVILECTSHALSKEYDRLATLTYDVAIVTTVTSEHMEFHKTHSAYVDAKCNLVRNLKKNGKFISTTDNPSLQAFLSCLTKDKEACILHRDIQCTIEKKEAGQVLCTVGNKTVALSCVLPCLASNAMLAALGASYLLHTPFTTLFPSLEELQPVTGRMNTIENPFGLQIFIDFAHTADAYEKLFSSFATEHERGKLIAVFGCAGERDTSKRAPMGYIAATYADILILTEEDPRKEGNEAIFSDLLSLVTEVGDKNLIIEKIPDRKKAIERAFSLSHNGDTLLFLGKGHETSIERAEGKIPWNEEEQVRIALHTYQKA